MNFFYKKRPEPEIEDPFDYANNEKLIFHLSFDSYHFRFVACQFSFSLSSNDDFVLSDDKMKNVKWKMENDHALTCISFITLHARQKKNAPRDRKSTRLNSS